MDSLSQQQDTFVERDRETRREGAIPVVNGAVSPRDAIRLGGNDKGRAVGMPSSHFDETSRSNRRAVAGPAGRDGRRGRPAGCREHRTPSYAAREGGTGREQEKRYRSGAHFLVAAPLPQHAPLPVCLLRVPSRVPAQGGFPASLTAIVSHLVIFSVLPQRNV